MITVLITGGYGFIASNFINMLTEYNIICVDKLLPCSNLKNITRIDNFKFIKGDIADRALISHILHEYTVNVVYHFAAQTHVDNSFSNPTEFINENVLGTSILLECCREYGKLDKFIHVSTDEVYGDVSSAQEDDVIKYGLINPTNPYAASKAAAELVALSYYKSFRLPVIITRSNNVYGPRQYWEKVIPRFLYLLAHGQKLTIQGDGTAKRKYLYVDDACNAYLRILQDGQVGKIYEMGSETELSVLELANLLTTPDNIEFVQDRPFHDQRYIANTTELKMLGWTQETPFSEGLRKTMDWYNNYAIPEKYWN